MNLQEDDNYVIWIGHSTFLINNGEINILVDPVFSERVSPFSFIGPKRMIPPAIEINQLPKIDIVLISHNHYDNLDTINYLQDRPHYRSLCVQVL